MLRRFNYTGRKKIPRSAVFVKLTRDEKGGATFDAKVDLSSLKLPGHAKVYVEAYHRASYMRFPYGQVSDVHVPEDRRLTQIDGGASALFRVKVIDESAEHGKVIAEADGVSPLDASDEAARRSPILPVVIIDLGQQIWRLSMADDRPVLEINKRIEGIAQIAHGDDHFLSLVYPSVVAEVLTHVLADETADLDGSPDDWRTQWLRFACSLPSIMPFHRPDLDDESAIVDKRREWVEDVVMAFCSHHKILERYARVHATPGGSP